MSKLSPLGQSMVGVLSPGNERVRAAEAKTTGAIRVPGMAPIRQEKSGDSTSGSGGNLGYEPWGKKKKKDEKEEEAAAPGPAGTVIETTPLVPGSIRLSAGWELILVAQKKICAKAKGIFTLLEAPVKYTSQKRNTFLQSKSRGSILDLDLQETQEKLAWLAKQEKDKEKESA